MKFSVLLFAGLMVSGLAFMSMSDKVQVASSVIDEVQVTDSSIPSTTVYYVERGLPTPGGVVIKGTLREPPTNNGTGGKTTGVGHQKKFAMNVLIVNLFSERRDHLSFQYQNI